MRRGSDGFTLLEVLVALAVAGVVTLGARAAFEGLADSVGRVAAAAVDADREANGERVLRALVGQLEVGLDRASEFAGTSQEVSFTSWCDVPGGWQERCHVRLAVEERDTSLVLAAHIGEAAEPLILRRGLRPDGLCYLSSPTGGGSWLPRWGAGVSPPIAIGIIVDADTIVVRIGERG